MSFDITYTPIFAKSLKALAKRFRSLKQDIKNLIISLSENPFQGDELKPGIRKIRMAITSKGKGKSGGARIITYTVVIAENEGVVHLIEIYDKSDASTVDVSTIQTIIKDSGI